MGLFDDLTRLLPVKKNFPSFATASFFDVARRANQILGDYDEDDIDAILTYTNQLVDQHGDEIANVVCEIWDADGEFAPTHFSRVRLLYIAREFVELSPPEGLEAVSWADLFAVMAMQQFQYFLEACQHYVNAGKPRDNTIPVTLIRPYSSAIEAITLAETLATATDFDSLLRSQLEAHFSVKRQDQARSASLSRHAKTNELLRELVAFYKSGDFSSYSEAVHQFLEATPEDRYRHLAPTNRERTLSQGLSAVIRGKRVVD